MTSSFPRSYVVFRASDVKDLQIESQETVDAQSQPPMNDPAIVTVRVPPAASAKAAYGLTSLVHITGCSSPCWSSRLSESPAAATAAVFPAAATATSLSSAAIQPVRSLSSSRSSRIRRAPFQPLRLRRTTTSVPAGRSFRRRLRTTRRRRKWNGLSRTVPARNERIHGTTRSRTRYERTGIRKSDERFSGCSCACSSSSRSGTKISAFSPCKPPFSYCSISVYSL